MGQNLSDMTPVDTSKDVLTASDRMADIFMAIFWAGSLYVCGMIFCICSLLGRWSGPNEKRGLNICSVLGAMLLSTGWPVVLLFMRR